MECSALMHYSDSIYSHAISGHCIELRLQTKLNDDISKVELIYNDKYKFHEEVKLTEIKKTCSDDYHDYYIIRLRLKDTRFAYIFKITTQDGKKYYYSESGVSETYDITQGFYDFFQVSDINDKDIVRINKKWQDRVCYQIFVDRFYQSSAYTNFRVNIKWGDKVDRSTIAGGNLKGVNEKISYLKDLGVDAIYLTPIFEAESNHKYDTINYFKVSKDFGTNNDLSDLIDNVHSNNMIIILDGVFNHVSNHSNLFLDVVKKGKKSKYFDWFFIDGDEVDEENCNYATFAYCPTLPRLNLNNREVQKFILKIGRYYVGKYHIDGFRLDVSDEIPHYFWIEFKKEMLKINKDFILIGENWHNAQSFLNSGKEFDSIMNYSITKDLLKLLANKEIDSKQFINRIYSDLLRYKNNVNYNLLNLVSSHDVDRFLKQCGENVDRFLMGYAFIFMHVGVPCIYYGDEIGLTGGYDPDNRRCFNWDRDSWNLKINGIIKEFVKIHKEKKMNQRLYKIKESDGLIILQRSNDKSVVTLVMNVSDKSVDYKANNILISNNLKNNELNPNGFVIYEEVK